jgi:hypothetical protein
MAFLLGYNVSLRKPKRTRIAEVNGLNHILLVYADGVNFVGSKHTSTLDKEENLLLGSKETSLKVTAT